MTGVVAAGLVLGAVGLGSWFLRRNRACPACQTPLETLASPDGLHTYEVLACPACPTAVSLSHGVRNRFAFCPRCGRAALETLCERLPDPPNQRLVRVKESCQLCGYTDERFVSSETGPEDEPPKPTGKILPFRR